MSDCCLTPSEQFFSHIVERTSYFLDNDVYFVLDYQAKLNFYNASSLKQQSTCRPENANHYTTMAVSLYGSEILDVFLQYQGLILQWIYHVFQWQ